MPSSLPYRILREYTWLSDLAATVPQHGAHVTQITDSGAQNRNLYPMEQILGWARLWFAARREDEGEAPLRNGAWYPILSSGVNRAVLEVSGQRVDVPQDIVEVREKRPDRFTVVYRPYDAPNPARGTRADAGRRYGVCPKCATRIAFRMGIIPSRATCHKCKHEGIVAWWETG